MASDVLLRIEGDVARPRMFSFEDLAAFEPAHQVADVSRLDAARRGDAVRLAGLLDAVGPRPAAIWLTLHSSSDNFHASIPLAAVREKAVLIYRLEGAPLPAAKGGPLRFFIPDHAACRTAEIDECANVKFVDRIELSAQRGHDNRPHDEEEHAALHRAERKRDRSNSWNQEEKPRTPN